MDDFSYLSVLISIVLGLGVTNLLLGLARVIQLRERVKIYWPTLAWALTLLLVHVQTWWTMFSLREIEVWTFPLFALVLLQPILLFFLSALTLPDFDRHDTLDLRSNYFAQARWFFGILLALLLNSLLRGALLSADIQEGAHISMGSLQVQVDLIFHLVFIGGVTCGIIWMNEIYHKVLAALSVGALVLYIATLFTKLH